jgi:hypothetical protein
MLGLVTFLQSSGVKIKTDCLKIHLACHNGQEHPIDIYYAGKFQQWQEGQSQRNFPCEQVIGLIDHGQGDWLFVGVYQIIGCTENAGEKYPYRYSTQLIPDQDELIGRVIVHHKRGRASYIYAKPEILLPIVEIRREKLTIGEFPGYNQVAISHQNLQTITTQQIATWRGALANIKGVYLITDTSTGKHYVGKASGGEGIWQRWCNYATDGHGGNEGLKKVLRENGDGHVVNFQYSIFEIADTHASDADILKRESHWMTVLKTRGLGLN